MRLVYVVIKLSLGLSVSRREGEVRRKKTFCFCGQRGVFGREVYRQGMRRVVEGYLIKPAAERQRAQHARRAAASGLESVIVYIPDGAEKSSVRCIEGGRGGGSGRAAGGGSVLILTAISSATAARKSVNVSARLHLTAIPASSICFHRDCHAGSPAISRHVRPDPFGLRLRYLS